MEPHACAPFASRFGYVHAHHLPAYRAVEWFCLRSCLKIQAGLLSALLRVASCCLCWLRPPSCCPDYGGYRYAHGARHTTLWWNRMPKPYPSRWYSKVFADYRRRYPAYKIAILLVQADPAVLLERCKRRGKTSGRFVPAAEVLDSARRVPKTVEVGGCVRGCTAANMTVCILARMGGRGPCGVSHLHSRKGC